MLRKLISYIQFRLDLYGNNTDNFKFINIHNRLKIVNRIYLFLKNLLDIVATFVYNYYFNAVNYVLNAYKKQQCFV